MNINDEIIEGLHDFYLLRLNTIVMFHGQPVKLTNIYQIRDRKILEYEFTNIFTKEKFTETVTDLQNHGWYWRHWSHGAKKFHLFLDAPVLHKTKYEVIHVDIPNKITCLNSETFEEKIFIVSNITAVKMDLLIKTNPDMEIKITEICWRDKSTLEFDQNLQ